MTKPSKLNPAMQRDLALIAAQEALNAFRAGPPAGRDWGTWHAGQAQDLARALELLLAVVRPEPAADRRTPDGCTAGDPVPAGLDPEADWAGRCKDRYQPSATGWYECDRPAGHAGQHVAVGASGADGSGPIIVSATWPAPDQPPAQFVAAGKQAPELASALAEIGAWRPTGGAALRNTLLGGGGTPLPLHVAIQYAMALDLPDHLEQARATVLAALRRRGGEQPTLDAALDRMPSVYRAVLSEPDHPAYALRCRQAASSLAGQVGDSTAARVVLAALEQGARRGGEQQ